MMGLKLGVVRKESLLYSDKSWLVKYGPEDKDELRMFESQFAGSLFPITVGDKVEIAYSKKSSYVGEWVAISRNDEDLDKEYA